MRAKLLIGILVFLSLPITALAQPRRARRVRITFLVDGEYSANEGFRGDVTEAIQALASDRWTPQFDPERDQVGDYTLATARTQLAAVLSSGDTDLIIALGALSGIAVGERESLPLPVIVPYTLEPEVAGLPLAEDHSGRANLAYISDGIDLQNSLRRFREIVPFSVVHVLMSESAARAAPGLADRTRALSQAVGGRVEVALTRGSRATEVLESLPSDVEAIFLSPLVRLEDGQVRALLQQTTQRRIPVFAFGGRHVCELGALGSITSEEDFVRRARRTATFVERWVDGEALADFDVSFAPTDVLYLNLRAANATGARPNWIMLTEAELVGDERPFVSRTLTLPQALNEALARNPDLAAAEDSLESARQDVDGARASLLPQLEVSATGVLLDEDRAQSLGSSGQLSANWRASFSQLLFSPRAWGGFETQQHVQRATAASRDTTRLDVLLQASEAYVNVLRANVALTVQGENLALSRANLRRARMRVRVGRSSEAEVVRWESTLATSQRDVLNAFAQLRAAEIELNRVLNRPLGESVRLLEAEAEPQSLLEQADGVDEQTLERYLNDPWSFRMLTDFLAAESLRNAPELRQVSALTEAQRRTLQMGEQRLFLPDIALTASLTHNFLDVGGENPRDIPMGVMGFPAIDPWDFQVGLQITLPIYLGGERYADLRRARAEISRLEHERRSIELRVEQGVRATMAAVGPAYANIELSQRAARAAQRNLELVNAAYLAGTVDILRVLDAQNQSVTAQLSAANAVYDLMLLILQAERRSGRFRLFAGEDERQDFLERLQSFASRHRFRQPTRTPAVESQ